MLNYKIALVNVFWSENENNTRYFINRNEQNIYFDGLANGKISPFVNFNMGNYIDTIITYRDESNRSIDDILKCNYAIVYKYEDGQIVNRRYYFAYPSQDSGRQMRVRLALDDIQTNFLSKQGFFDQQVMITRAHLNRFIRDGNNFKFNIGTSDSPFYQIEDFKECPKRLTKRTSLTFSMHSDFGTDWLPIKNWYNENVIGWQYVYLAPTEVTGTYSSYKYKVLDGNDVEREIELPNLRSLIYGSSDNTGVPRDSQSFTDGNKLTGALICICAPVYKNNSYYGTENSIIFDGVSISTKGLDLFLNRNGKGSRVYSRKFSIRPPFNTLESPTQQETHVDGNNLIISGDVSDPNRPYQDLFHNTAMLYTGFMTDVSNVNHKQGCFVIYYDDLGNKSIVTNEYIVDKQLTFSVSEIVESSKDNFNLNPKLLSNQFFDLNITHFSQSYTYDFEKIGHREIQIAYDEALTPDITKGYARLNSSVLDPNYNGLYIDKCSENLTGLVISNDQSLMVANDRLSEMLANNKNFFMQQALNIGKSVLGGAVGGGFAGIGGVAGSVLGLASGLSNTFMNLDNMRSSPAQINNGNGNVYFASQIQPFKLAIEEYEALDYDKKAFNDYCYMFGYKYNRMGLLRDFVNIRSQFNYIEADLINVSVPMQNEEKQRLTEKFRYGIRFWNTDLPDFSMQNCENDVLEVYRGEIANE